MNHPSQFGIVIQRCLFHKKDMEHVWLWPVSCPLCPHVASQDATCPIWPIWSTLKPGPSWFQFNTVNTFGLTIQVPGPSGPSVQNQVACAPARPGKARWHLRGGAGPSGGWTPQSHGASALFNFCQNIVFLAYRWKVLGLHPKKKKKAVLLNVVVTQRASILQLLPGKNQALLVRRNTCLAPKTLLGFAQDI